MTLHMDRQSIRKHVRALTNFSYSVLNKKSNLLGTRVNFRFMKI